MLGIGLGLCAGNVSSDQVHVVVAVVGRVARGRLAEPRLTPGMALGELDAYVLVETIVGGVFPEVLGGEALGGRVHNHCSFTSADSCPRSGVRLVA